MIINKIVLSDEDKKKQAFWDKKVHEAVNELKKLESGTITYEEMMKVSDIAEAFGNINSAFDVLEMLKREAEARYVERLGSSDAILDEAREVIQALEKKDFQDFVRPVRKRVREEAQDKILRKDAAFRQEMKRYTFTFEGAYKFVLQQVAPYYRVLEQRGESTGITETDGKSVSYIELLQVEVLRKVRDDFGYTPPSERKKGGRKKTTSLQEELTTVEDIGKSGLYNKMVSDATTGAMETSIGKKPTTDPIAQYRYIETKYGQLTWDFDNGQELLAEVDRKAIPAETVLLVNMLLEKLTSQIPTLKHFKGKLKPAEQKELDAIRDKLKDEKCRTVSLTLGEYMTRRNKDGGNKSAAKKVIEYALKSAGTVEAYVDGRTYNMFSSKPQEMYRAGNVEAVFNYDWCTHLYTDRSKIVWFPDALYSVDMRKHQHAISLYGWLRQNYESNTYRQKPNTNRVKIGTTIENVPELKAVMEKEKGTSGRIYQRVVEPLLNNLEALKKVYGVLDYEILGKDTKKITGSRFNKLSNKEKMECWIRYEFTGYPNWKAPEQLSARKKQEKKE